jgi:DNA-binding cell septation regulator SpoVG
MSVNGIEITEIKINPVPKKEGSHLEAFARIVLNGQLCINSIRVVHGKFGPFISFPREFNQKEGKGYNLCYPITKALQDYLSERILRQWRTVSA